MLASGMYGVCVSVCVCVLFVWGCMYIGGDRRGRSDRSELTRTDMVKTVLDTGMALQY